MGTFGILTCGAYIPRNRMSRASVFDAVGWAQPSLKSYAKGARAFASWDEDAVTMGVEAARVALAGAPSKPEAICFASTTAPFLDRQNAGIIAAALDLPEQTHVFDMTGSQRAATSALIRCFHDRKTSLLTTADCRSSKSASMMEMLSGDAGAALVVGDGDPVAEIAGVNSIYADLVDHYRTAQSGTDYILEERWFRDEGVAKLAARAAGPLLEEARITAEDIDHLIVPTLNPALAGAAAKAIGAGKDSLADSLFKNCGHAGAAHPILMLAGCLASAKPGEWILIATLGQGCDAILLRTTQALAGAQANDRFASSLFEFDVEENYVRFLAARGGIDIDWGMRAERDNRTAQTVAYNKSRDIYGFVGGVCSACKTPQFPKSRRCVNPDCSALDTQTDYRFADRKAQVKSFTEDWLAFTREPPLVYGNVSFEGGGNVFMEMSGFKPGDISIGSSVDINFRIKDIDPLRGFHRYFWKAVPYSGGAHG